MLDIYTLSQAAFHCKVTRQAIYVAIKKKRLKAVKIASKWSITRQDLDDYRLNKYNRDMRKFNDEYVFDIDKGRFSVSQVSKIFSTEMNRHYPINRLYYLIRVGRLKASKAGCAWIIDKDEAVKLLEQEQFRKIA